MPNIAALHPQVVHFVVACLFLGFPLYVLGFTQKLRWARHAATVLLVVGTVASIGAVKSGTDAHGPAERIPDTRALVVEHEELGERTRNAFAIVLLLELAALAAAWHVGRGNSFERSSSSLRFAPNGLRAVATVGWVLGAVLLFETAEHGGELVYEHAGGIGFRSGDTGDVGNLLLAGLYHQSRLDRESGDAEGAARLVTEMAERFPQSVEVQLLLAESLLMDTKDGRAALDFLATVPVPSGDARMTFRKILSTSDAYESLAMPDSALAALNGVPEQYRENGGVRTRRERMGG